MHAPSNAIVNGRHGRFFIQDDAYIGRSLSLYGEYSEGEVALFRHFVGARSVVVEAGANIGALTVPLAKMASHVIAIEPQPENRDLLRRNVGANDVGTKIDIRRCAVGARNGKTTIPELRELSHRNFGAVEIGNGRLPVTVIMIDDIVGAMHVDFIKIDVEGSEREALLGARQTIERCRPVLYVECDRPDKAPALMALLHEYGYSMWHHQPPLFNPDNHFKNGNNAFGNIVSFNLLCVHNSLELDREVFEKLEPVKFDPFMPAAAVARQIMPSDDQIKGAITEIRKAVARNATKWACVVRLGGVGDNLIAASALAPLKRQGFMVEVIAAEPQHVVFENNPSIDKLSVKNPTRDLPQNDMIAWQAWFKSRGNEYERFANLSHSLEYLTGFLPEQSAFYWRPEMRRHLADRNYLEVVHDIVGVPHEFGPLFFPTEEEKEQAAATKAEIGGRCIGWCLSGTRIDKMHPFSAMVIARIIRETGIPVVMMGTPGKEFLMSRQIMEHVERQNGSIDGLHQAISPDPEKPTWPLRRSLSFAAACDLVIGPDTGPMWSVAFEQMPKIMLLSHASPTNITRHWRNTITLHADQSRVPCWPCHQLHNTIDTCTPNKEKLAAACISDISTEAIIAAVKTLLKTGETSK